MSVKAYVNYKDFGEPEIDPSFEEEVEDDRLDPADVADIIEKTKAAAFAEGRRQGYAEGQEAERASITKRIEDETQRLTAAVAELTCREEELFADLETRTSRLLLALIHQLARRLSEEEAKRLAENVTVRAIEAVRGKHVITIRAAEEILVPLRAVLRMPTDEQAADHRIVFETAEEESTAPLEVAWLTGKVTFDPYAFTEAIDKVFTETLDHLMGSVGQPAPEGEQS